MFKYYNRVLILIENDLLVPLDSCRIFEKNSEIAGLLLTVYVSEEEVKSNDLVASVSICNDCYIFTRVWVRA